MRAMKRRRPAGRSTAGPAVIADPRTGWQPVDQPASGRRAEVCP